MKRSDQKLSLLFSFYLTPDFKENVANKMHFECLKEYSSMFKDATFVILTDDVNDKESIAEVEKMFIECGYMNNCRFMVEQNNPFCESYVFKKYLVDRLYDYTSPVLFAHNKGVTNVKKSELSINDILMWIYGLYSLSLDYSAEAFEFMCMGFWRSIFFGGFMSIEDTENSDLKYLPSYNGTIFIINPGNLIEYINERQIEIPPIGNRWYTEHFPRTILLNEKRGQESLKATSHNQMYFYAYYPEQLYKGKYGGVQDLCKFMFGDDFPEFQHRFETAMHSIGR